MFVMGSGALMLVVVIIVVIVLFFAPLIAILWAIGSF